MISPLSGRHPSTSPPLNPPVLRSPDADIAHAAPADNPNVCATWPRSFPDRITCLPASRLPVRPLIPDPPESPVVTSQIRSLKLSEIRSS